MRTVTIYVSDPLYAKLVTVAAKCSGQDKPSQEQIDNTLALLAHSALISAHAQVTQPEPVTRPLPAITLTPAATSGYASVTEPNSPSPLRGEGRGEVAPSVHQP